jgi:hypothetical protein
MPHILLATYNGARYLPEWLASLRAQSLGEWRLLCRDDGSTDDTAELLAVAADDDSRIRMVNDGAGRAGAAGNFGRLMQAALDDGAEYAFFADQDDVWLPDKLERQMAAMRELETEHGRKTPLLVHTDLTVVDAELRVLNPSYRTAARVHHDPADPLGCLLVANHVTGCATLVNRRLLEAATPLPASVVIHDWWVAQVAAGLGSMHYLPESTLLYRQHGANAIGAAGFWSKLNPLDGGLGRRWRKSLAQFVGGIEQVRALDERLRQEGCDAEYPAVRRVGEFLRAIDETNSAIGRWLRMREAGYGRASRLRQAVLAARLMALGGAALGTPRRESNLGVENPQRLKRAA